LWIIQLASQSTLRSIAARVAILLSFCGMALRPFWCA
jgi:hypothetical protein